MTLPVRHPDETLYSSALTSPELVWRLSPDWKLLSVSRGYHACTQEDVLRGGYPLLRRLLAGKDPAVLDGAILEAMRRRSPLPPLETVGFDPDREEDVHFISTLTGRRGSDRQAIVEGRSRDVTLLLAADSVPGRASPGLETGRESIRLGSARHWKDLLRQVLAGALDVVGGTVGGLLMWGQGSLLRIGFPSVAAARPLCRWMSTVGPTMEACGDELRIVEPRALPSCLRAMRFGAVVLLRIRLENGTGGMVALTSWNDPVTLERHRDCLLYISHELGLTLRDVMAAEKPTALCNRRSGHIAEQHRQRIFGAFAHRFSNGKLRVLTIAELHRLGRPWIDGPDPDARLEIRDPTCLAALRRAVESRARAMGFDEERVVDMAICVTEAATNVLVHGRRGSLAVRPVPHALQIWIQDHGQGVDIARLARSAFLKTGASSVISLGMGINIMLEMSDRMLVQSGPAGTTIILEYWTSHITMPHPEQPAVASVADYARAG